MKQKLAAIFRQKTRTEWEAFSKQHDCCVEPVLEPHELQGDEHLRARGVFFEIDSPWGRIKQLRTPVTPHAMNHVPPPKKGEHTDAILREAGIDQATIDALMREGAAR